MDITQTAEPRSDQQNFDDYSAGSRTVTITEVKAGSSEQPVEIHLAEYPGRPYKPSKTMRRVLIAAWGPETKVYAGRRMTLIGDPSVKFGGVTVGGIKIAALSNIDKRLELMLTASKGKRAKHTVQPLTEPAPIQGEPSEHAAPPEPTAEQVAASTSPDDLRAMWKSASADLRTVIEARVTELTAEPETPDPADELPIAGEGA